MPMKHETPVGATNTDKGLHNHSKINVTDNSDVSQRAGELLVHADRTAAKTTSLIVAEKFGKRHSTVLRTIQNLGCSDDFRQRNFAATFRDIPCPNGATRQEPMYEITRDGFSMLAMGFTGKAAMIWKEKFITAFNTMEKALSSPKRDKSWIEQRRDTAATYRVMGQCLQMAREDDGKETKRHHYTNEALMLNELLTGKRSPLDRESLSKDELRLLTSLEQKNASLILAHTPYNDRKEILRKDVTKARQKVLPANNGVLRITLEVSHG